MMTFWSVFWLLMGVHLLAVASPGPDFVLVSQHTLKHGRQAGLWCAFGIVLGLSVHILYSILGLTTIIIRYPNLLTLIQWLGGFYLIYLGYRGLTAKQNEPIESRQYSTTSAQQNNPHVVTYQAITKQKSILMGMTCNLLNPKAPIYFIALFTVVLSPDMPIIWLVTYAICMVVLECFWFSLVAMVLSHQTVYKRFQRIGHWIDRIFGGLMLALGIELLRN